MRHAFLLLLAVLALSAAPAAAQVQSFHGDLPGDLFGESVAGVGDVNGDGCADVLVGARHEFNAVCTGTEVSYLRVFCGLTGAVLRTHPIDGDDHRGRIVKGLGDMNGDGFPDYGDANGPDICCAPTSPALKVYSGQTGALLHSFTTEWWDIYGRSLDAAGDANNNGFDDVVYGQPDWDTASFLAAGRVTLREGQTGTLLRQFAGSAAFERIGHSVAGVGDWDGDLQDDVAYSSGPDWSSPYTRVITVAGTVLFDLPFAGEIQDPGDYDVDGTRDLFLVTSDDRARVFSGADQSVLITLPLWKVYRIVPDVNGDGTIDFLVSDPLAGAGGIVAVLDGATGAELIRLREGAPGDRAGYSIGAAGDVNGDGLGDFLVGSTLESRERGAAHVYLAPCPPSPASYCPGLPNSVGPGATLGIEGTWSLGNEDLRLVSTGCPPNQFGVMIYGATPTGGTPVGEGLLCIAGSLYRLKPAASTGPGGVAEHLVDFGVPPAGSGPGKIDAGSTWHFQFWYRDPAGGPVGSNFSAGLSVAFCP